MSAGSGASNLGYGNITPFSNVNGNFVNKYSENNPATFGSNEIPGLPGLAGAKSNIDAAAGYVPGICLFKGGAKGFKRKIKNITKRYKKMAKSRKMNLSRKLNSLKKKLRSRLASLSSSFSFRGGRRHKSRRHRSRRQRGGYAQYQNNMPVSNSYSIGGVLSASESALANPAPIDKVTNNAIDNYNHYTNVGFPSRGH
jgi:hypothetical protein